MLLSLHRPWWVSFLTPTSQRTLQLRRRCCEQEASVEDLQRRTRAAEDQLFRLRSQVRRYFDMVNMRQVMASVGVTARALERATSTMSPEWTLGPSLAEVAAACMAVLSSCRTAIQLQQVLENAVAPRFAPAPTEATTADD
jgi:hypothetical protein